MAEYENEMRLFFTAKSENESFARIVVASFAAALDPTISEITDIKTAVSEAVTNAIIHGYEKTEGMVELFCGRNGRTLTVIVSDKGCGIPDIEKAKEPLFTSKPELERSGMGFTIMETFMDSMRIESRKGEGTSVIMTKELAKL